MTERGAAEQRRNREVIAAFRADGGRVKGRPHLLLLRTIGARSGKERAIPLRYSRDRDRLIVVASDEGSPQHPQWFHNVVAQPTVVVEIGTERFEAIATVATGRERRRLLDAHIRAMPFFAGYERKAAPRRIPVMVLRPA